MVVLLANDGLFEEALDELDLSVFAWIAAMITAEVMPGI
jgi:hypothetical protein